MYLNEIKINNFQDDYRDFKTIFGGGTALREPVQKFNKLAFGTGTVAYNTTLERYELAVSANGDYAILQQNFNNPYFEGNRQIFDITCEYLQPQADVIKRYGYFDMISVGVDFTKIDGILLETDDTKVYLRTYHVGVLGFSQEVTNLTDWEKFAVLNYNFLWLGGALLTPNLFLQTVGIKQLTQNTQVGQSGQFIFRPNKPITMAIESTGGAGYTRYICSMVATKQIESWGGINVPLSMNATVPTNAIGTYYHLKSVKIKQSYTRGASIIIDNIDVRTAGTADIGKLFVTKNPVITNTYADLPNSLMQHNTDNIGSVIALANIGEVIAVFNISGNSALIFNPNYYSKFIPINIDGDNPIYSFIFQPQTSTMDTTLTANFIEFR